MATSDVSARGTSGEPGGLFIRQTSGCQRLNRKNRAALVLETGTLQRSADRLGEVGTNDQVPVARLVEISSPKPAAQDGQESVTLATLLDWTRLTGSANKSGPN